MHAIFIVILLFSGCGPMPDGPVPENGNAPGTLNASACPNNELFAIDLANECRCSPPSPGALEAYNDAGKGACSQ